MVKYAETLLYALCSVLCRRSASRYTPGDAVEICDFQMSIQHRIRVFFIPHSLSSQFLTKQGDSKGIRACPAGGTLLGTHFTHKQGIAIMTRAVTYHVLLLRLFHRALRTN